MVRIQRAESSDRDIRENLIQEIKKTGIRTQFVNTVVADSIANIYGTVQTLDEKKALAVAVENVTGLKAVNLHVGVLPVPGFGI